MKKLTPDDCDCDKGLPAFVAVLVTIGMACGYMVGKYAGI